MSLARGVSRYELCYWLKEPEAGVLFSEFIVQRLSQGDSMLSSGLYCSDSTDTLQHVYSFY